LPEGFSRPNRPNGSARDTGHPRHRGANRSTRAMYKRETREKPVKQRIKNKNQIIFIITNKPFEIGRAAI